MNDKKRIIATNLTALRKNKGITQAELAEKMNYSDKAISRWEHGDTLPDIDMLCELCDFYGITLNDLIDENFNIEADVDEKINKSKSILGYRAWLGALCVSVVWLCATIIFVYSRTIGKNNFWMVFVWAVPISCIMIRINIKALPKKDLICVINSSVLSWTFITCLYLQLLVRTHYNMWPMFIVGVPVQIIIVIFYKLKQLRG